jgi:hypothetical protein
MNPALNAYLANELIHDRVRAAEQQRRAREAREEGEAGGYVSVIVRLAGPNDWAAIHRLEQLEGRQLPAGPALLAEAGGSVLAARSLSRRELVADPWRPTAELVELLDLRSLHLRGELERRHRLRALGVRRLLRALAPSRL